ncbi:FAD-binding oxidoreductase [Tepidamorphus sp. 3E244]|uniref:FAD-binding oxidoreductase n=1 Tax=Tepidamorphus sp. 3E244 TaxID=3385498 RepID=UPI0038FC465C
MAHRLKILDTGWNTHDVRRIKLEKPESYEFTPGQATEVAIDKEGWRDEKRPFTFTSLNEWPYLEFHIKVYPGHDGVTEQIGKLQPGDHLLLDDPWGTIEYKGKGSFIAGGAGVTPFIAILRQLNENGELAGNKLLFSNTSERDIILREEFEAMDGLDCVFTVTDQDDADVLTDRIDRGFLKAHATETDSNFYVCGPDKMVEDISKTLRDMGADPDGITFEA